MSERIIKQPRVAERPVVMCGDELRRLLETHGHPPGKYADAAAIERDVHGIIAAAREEAERIEAAARSAGYEAGLAEARQKIAEEIADKMRAAEEQAAELLRNAEQRAEDILRAAEAQATQTLTEAREARERMLRDTEPVIVQIAIAVAKKIVARELSEHSVESAVALAREAIAQAATNEEVVIHVHPQDKEGVEACRAEVLRGGDPSLHVRIEPDPSVPPGNAVAQTALGMVDARVETQFEELVRELETDAPLGNDTQ